tara:strand:+ start:4702 stop:5370 length:669 start_codon:yes stop_codon:yes gene_type:complete
MSITFPKTWAASEKVQATDVRDNLDAMTKKQAKLGAADFATGQWIDTHHIMEGRYEPTGNISVNVSGVFGGRNNGSFLDNLSYCSRWITDRTGATGSSVPRAYIPFSNITFDILRPCTLFFQWSMIHQSPIDGDGTDGYTRIRPALNAKNVSAGIVYNQVYEQVATGASYNVLIDGTRTTNGMVLLDVAGQVRRYSIGLTGESTAGMCQNVSWSVSLECFYM